MRIHAHAIKQCADRDFPVDAVLRVIAKKMGNDKPNSAAVLIGWTADRWSSGLSNGDEVWAVIRDGEVKTVMLRRGTQPKTRGALRVDAVYA